jgi:hypothetical protein
MRLLVVLGLQPKISTILFPYRNTHAHPPGPGLRMHAPSVVIKTLFSGVTLQCSLRRRAAIESFKASATSALPVITWAGPGMCDATRSNTKLESLAGFPFL